MFATRTALIDGRCFRRRLSGFGTLVFVFLVDASCPTSVQGQALLPSPDKPIVTLSEFELRSQPPARSYSTCINVWEDGRFHLERRSQQLPSPTVKLVVYESTLPEGQFRELREFIEGEALRNLPHPVPADPSVAKTSVRGMQVSIARLSGIQEIGYFEWETHDPGDASTPPHYVVHAPQDEIEIVLKPLEDWLHNVDATHISSGDSSSTSCQTEEEGTTDSTSPWVIDAQSKVSKIMERVLSRCYTIADGETSDHHQLKGVTRMSWSPPTAEDYADIARLGDQAIPALVAYFSPDLKQGGFEQLLAVKFLESIGTPATVDPLGAALASGDWEVARFSALEALGQRSEPQALSLIRSLIRDDNTWIATRAEQILGSRQEVVLPPIRK